MKSTRPSIKRYSLRQLKRLEDKTDYQRLDNMTDQEIDYSDNPATDETFWQDAEIHDPGTKKLISLRVDNDVLSWFKHRGGRYQRLMNEVLRKYMEAHRRS